MSQCIERLPYQLKNPHSRRKPGSTYQATEPLKGGSRLSPGMRFFGIMSPVQNEPHSAERLNAECLMYYAGARAGDCCQGQPAFAMTGGHRRLKGRTGNQHNT